uniref:Phosphoinositide phospholipase C n=1 Tax=Elaeophora elaphi TaxID=1147741 RepID=A0A158Q7B3_9BILA
MTASVVGRLVSAIHLSAAPPKPNSFLVFVCKLASSHSNSSAIHGFIIGDEPIALFRSELEKLQHILHFPEELAFQLSATEYQLFYEMQPMDYVHYVSCDLTSVPVSDNPSPIRNLVKRLSEISSWITHLIISLPTSEERKTTLTSILRMIDVCWNIGNFNAAVEILMGLKSEKLRSFWLSLKPEEKKKYEQLCEALLPSNQAALSATYREAIQRALNMPQCRLIPFFGVFLRDLYAIVNDMPSVVMAGDEDDREKLQFLNEQSGDSHCASDTGVSGLLNADKISLVAVVLDNLELFYRHYKNVSNFVVDPTAPSVGKENLKPKGYDPVQPIKGIVKNITLVPLDTNRFDLDVIQRLHHGTTVIRYDPDTGRSALCILKLDASCGLLLWRKVGNLGTKEMKEKVSANLDVHIPSVTRIQSAKPQSITPLESRNPPSSPSLRPAGAACTTLDCGFLKLSYVKSIENVASSDIDIETIYRRYSSEEMSVQMHCWTINFGCYLSDNEFVYFIAPEKSAQCWTVGLTTVCLQLQLNIVNYLLEQHKCADRRVIWLRRLYLQLCTNCEQDNMIDEGVTSSPQPYKALQAFGGRAEGWKGLQSIFSKSLHSITFRFAEVMAAKGRLKRVTSAVTRRMKFVSRSSAHSQSPQPLISIKTRYQSVRNRISGQQCTISDPSTPKETSRSRDSSSSTDTSLTSWYKSRRLSARALGSFWSAKVKNRTKGPEDTNLSPTISTSPKSYEGEYSEKPVTLFEFIELYKLFSANMRTDLKNIFNNFLVMCGCGSENAIKHESNEKTLQMEPSLSDIEFIPNDILTRNTFTTTQHIDEKQQKVYNALTLASLNSTGLTDASKCSFLTPAMLKQFIEIHQMEIVNDDYAAKIIQEHEPDRTYRRNQQLSFEGFVRYMTDSTNYAFVPEAIKPDQDTLHYPLNYYYICSSHNTYLTGHQLKGESSTEMYRQVLLTGCRCVELDCWDGENGMPQIFHGHTLTSKIGFREVLSVIKKSAFVTSNLPVILSIENHCSLQQQGRMAQMFKNYLGEKLVTYFLFEADYSSSPRLPSPWQLQNKILIKNKKMIAEPSAGPRMDRIFIKNESDTVTEQADGFYGTDEDDVEEFYDDLDDEEADSESPRLVNRLSRGTTRESSSEAEEDHKHAASVSFDSRIDDESFPVNAERVFQRPTKKIPGPPVARELSDLVNYMQATKFKGFPRMVDFVHRREELTKSSVLGTIRAGSNLLPIGTPPRRLRNVAIPNGENKLRSGEEVRCSITSSSRPNSNASCYQVTSFNESSARKLSRKHPLEFIAYSRKQIVRTYPGGMRIDSSNFNPIQYWAFGLQMVALNFQTADTAMAVNAAMFEQTGNCGYTLKPRILWDNSHPYYDRFNPLCKDTASISALLYTVSVISGQHVCPNQHGASTYVEVEIIGIPADCAKEKSKTVSRNSVNPIWNHTSTFRIAFVSLAFLRISVCDNTNGRCVAQRVVPVRCIRAGYRHLPLRTPTNVPMDQGTVFLYSHFEQEEHIYLHDEDSIVNCNIDQQLHPQILQISPMAMIRIAPIVKRQIFILRISGLYNDETSVVVHAESFSTVKDVVQMALTNAGKNADTAEEYVLVEVNSNEILSNIDEQQHLQCEHRILPSKEPIMDFVACWNGSMRRFFIRKKGTASLCFTAKLYGKFYKILFQGFKFFHELMDFTNDFVGQIKSSRCLFQDPSGRAWISSIIKVGVGTTSSSIQSSSCAQSPLERKVNNRSLGQHVVLHRIKSLDPDILSEKKVVADMRPLTRTMSGTFLVCIHNVSEDKPYVIFRANIYSTASDIIKEVPCHVFLKSKQTNINESEYVLVEETMKETNSSRSKSLEPSISGNFVHCLIRSKKILNANMERQFAGVVKLSDYKNVSMRVLASNEIVWKAQSAWKTSGRFVLENREHTIHSTREKVRNLLQALENAHVNAGSPPSMKH